MNASWTGRIAAAALLGVASASAVAQTEGNLVNLSARLRVPAGGAPVIAGFVLQGTGPRLVLVRAVGPGLTGFGVAGPLANPKLTIFDAAGAIVAVNDDWETSGGGAGARQAAVDTGAFPLAAGSRDAALAVALAPGAHTVHVAGADAAGGVALVELYKVGPGAGGLANLSVRGAAGTGSDTLINPSH